MAENDTQQDDSELIDAFLQEEPDVVDDDSFITEAQEDDRRNLLGDNYGGQTDKVAVAQTADVLASEIDDPEVDTDLAKQQIFEEIAEDEVASRNVFPLPEVDPGSLKPTIEEYVKLMADAKAKQEKQYRDAGYPEDIVKKFTNQYMLALTTGSALEPGFSPIESLGNQSNVIIASDNPYTMIRQQAYDAKVLEIERAKQQKGFFDRNIALAMAYLPTVSAENAMDVADAIDAGIVKPDAEFLMQVDKELEKDSKITKYDAYLKVAEDFKKAGKRDYLSEAPISDVEKQQREELGFLGSRTTQDVFATGVGVGVAVPVIKKGFQRGFELSRGGGVKGKLLGGVAGAGVAATGLFGGAGIGSLGYMATDAAFNVRFGLEDEEYDLPLIPLRKTTNGVLDVLSGMSDAVPGFASMQTRLEILPAATRAQLTTEIVNLAVDLGLSDKINEMPSVKEWLDSASKNPALTQQAIENSTQDTMAMFYGPLNWALQTAFHPLIEEEIKETLDDLGLVKKDSEYWKAREELKGNVLSEFGIKTEVEDKPRAEVLRASMLQDVAAEIIGSPEYREKKNFDRIMAIGRMRAEAKEETSLRALEFNEDTFYKEYEKFEREPEKYTKYDKQIAIDTLINSSTWDSANKKWRGKEPNVENAIEVVKDYYERGFDDLSSETYPELYRLMTSIKNDAPKDEVQLMLNSMPLYYVEKLNASNRDPIWARPSFDDMMDFAKEIYEFKHKERGATATRIATKGFERSMFKLISDQGGDYLIKPTLLKRAQQFLQYGSAIGGEIPWTTPDITVPFLEKMGVPKGYIGSGAGLDREFGTGVRAHMPNLWARASSSASQLIGGSGTGVEEVYAKIGITRDDPRFAWALFGHATDFLPYESFAINSVVKPTKFAMNINRLSKNKMFKDATGPGATRLAFLEAFDGIRTSKSTDAVKAYHEALVTIMRTEIAEGRNPLRFLTAAEQDLFNDMFTATGRNPDDAKAAMEKATTVANNIRGLSKKVKSQVGDNDYVLLRASPSYQRLRADIDRLVQAGVIDGEYADSVMSMIEYQAITAAKSSGGRSVSPEQILQDTVVTYNKPPGAGINPTIRIVDVDENPLSGQSGVPRGYFEYDDRTGRAVINLFKNGDINTVWKMEGHLISHIMGVDFRNRVFTFFDHEYNNAGQIRLTDSGKRQFAEAWSAYRRTADNPNGFIRRMFDDLWLGVQNYWSKLRRKPRVLPTELRDYWDLEFGELPTDIRKANSLSSGAIFHRLRRQHESSTRPVGEQAAMRSRESMVKNLGYDESVVRSLFGDRRTKTVRNVRDLESGEIKRVVESQYLPRKYDTIDATIQAIAMIKTADFRKRTGNRKYVNVGTDRYHVSESSLNHIVNRVRSRLSGAMGENWQTTKKKIFQVNRDRVNVLRDQSLWPSNVASRDVNAFADRMSAASGKRDGMEVATQQEFFVLDARQEAGLKTLLQEIGNQPEADALPLQLLDPYANLKILSNAEYEKIQQVLMDIEATPLNRRSRNVMERPLYESISQALTQRGFETIADLMKVSIKYLSKDTYLPAGSHDPAIADAIRGGVRKMKAAYKQLIEIAKSKDFKNIDTVAVFFKSQLDRAVSRIPLSYLDDLEKLMMYFGNAETDMVAKATEDALAAKASGVTPIPVTRFSAAEIETPTIEGIFRKLASIQQILDGPFGMTARERESLNVLRSLKIKMDNGKKMSDLNGDESAIVADAINVLHQGLIEKDAYVQDIGERLIMRALALQTMKPTFYGAKGSRRTTTYKTYKAWFSGTKADIDYLFEQPDFSRDVFREFRVPGPKVTLQYGGRGKKITSNEIGIIDEFKDVVARKVGRELPEVNLRMISMLMLMKMDDVQHEIAQELLSLGYNATRRDVVGSQPLSSQISVDRYRYPERVIFYLNRELDQSDIIKFGGSKSKAPLKPGDDLYGPTEVGDVDFKTKPQPLNELDFAAQHEAHSILNRGGFRIENGDTQFIRIGDKYFAMPKNILDVFEDTMQAQYPYLRFKYDWGKNGSGEYFLDGIPDNKVRRRLQQTAAAIGKVASIMLSPTSFYTGLLIGTGGLPMVGYGMGVFIGGLSQLHLGSGARAVVRDAVAGPLVLTETARLAVTSLSDSTKTTTSFTAGVLARLHGRNSAVPETPPLLLPDGRVITADQVANSVDRYGWRGSMVDRVVDQSAFNEFYEQFAKSNPVLVGTTLGALLGITVPGASVVASTVFGATLGKILNPANGFFTKTHKFYRESFSAIDSFLRIKVLTDELKRGASMEQAAARTRTVALDYSNLSEAERSFIGRYFAFYTYYRESMGLFLKALADNPQRVINQLKFIQKTQEERTDKRLAQGELSSYDDYRAFLPFKIGDEFYRMPFFIAGDDFAILLEAISALPFINDTGKADALRKLLARASPQILLGLEALLEIDPVRGTKRSESAFTVPYHIVKLDRVTTGGYLWNLLDIKHYKASEIRWDEDEGKGRKRVSMNAIEHPGRGVYIAQNKSAYIYLMNYLQTPLTGRMGDNFVALQRANIDPIDSILDALEYVSQEYNDGDPILSTVGPLLLGGVVTNKDAGFSELDLIDYTDPADPRIAPLGDMVSFENDSQLDTARIDLLKSQGKAFERDGRTYVYTDQFYPGEAAKAVGFSRSPKIDRQKDLGMKLRARIARLKEMLDVEETPRTTLD